MGPSTESLALADFLISKLGLQVDRISLAYAIMDHVEVEYADELAQPSPGGQDALAWVVGDGVGARWRMWGDFGPKWTTDHNAALHFARRSDAEAFAKDDEEAWVIQPVDLAARQPVGDEERAETYRKGWEAGNAAQAVDMGLQLDRYDAGLLGDGGGGDVGWWQDYIRTELDRAHEFYQDQADSQAVGK